MANMKEHVTLEVKESVSPYGEMMKLLEEYIDKHDTITYCDALPDEGETDHLYIVRTGEAYIWENEWIELTGGGGTTGITGINLNGTPQEVINHVVDLLIKTSDLENDSGYITDSALEGYAKTEDIPTELSDLKNDMGYITEDALDGYALEDEIPTKVSQLENDADYTTVEDTKAEIAEQIAEIVAGAPESLDTLKEIADWIEHHEDDAAAMNTAIKEAKETADNALTEAEAVKDSIPTKVSELENDEGYITDSALDDYAKESYVDNVQEAVDALKDAAITGITLNGDEVSVTANIAGIEFDDVSNGSDGIKTLTVDGDLFDYVNETCDTIGVYFMRATSDTPNIPEVAAFFIMLLRNSTAQATMIAFRAGSNTNTYMCKEQASSWGEWTQIIPASGEAPIEHIAVNGEEQPIEDKTVDLSIDRASVDGETLVVGDTAGGGSVRVETVSAKTEIGRGEVGYTYISVDGEPIAALNAWTDTPEIMTAAGAITDGTVCVYGYNNSSLDFSVTIYVNLLYKI